MQAVARRARRHRAGGSVIAFILAIGSVVAAVCALAAGTAGTAAELRRVTEDRVAATLVVWATANLPPNRTLYAGSALVQERLRGVGLDIRTAPVVGRQRAGFVVDGATGGVARGSTAVPVASFGTGRDRLVVAAVLVASTSGVDQAQRAGARLRAQAGSELLANPQLVVGPAARASLRSGAVDLRALAFLAQAASSAQIVLVAVTADPSEAAAGLAARTVVLRRPTPGQLSVLVAATPAPYHPDVVGVTSVGGGEVTTLQWPLAAPADALAELAAG